MSKLTNKFSTSTPDNSFHDGDELIDQVDDELYQEEPYNCPERSVGLYMFTMISENWNRVNISVCPAALRHYTYKQ
jgi:hypothetical protein